MRKGDKEAPAINLFNARQASRGRFGNARLRLDARRAEIAPTRTDIETFFDLIDLDDEKSFGLTDLSRHPPRSVFDESVGGLAGLARMIDKFRALRGGTLGEYWCGEESGFDRAVLGFFELSQEEFSQALKERTSDEAVARWLSDRPSDRGDVDKTEFNAKLLTWGPDDEQKWTFFRNAVNQLDPIRRDLESWAALTVLDDQVYFARLKAGV